MKELERKLDSSMDIYKSFFDNNAHACYIVDLQGNFLLFNDAAVQLTGYSKEEALQMSFIPLIDEADLKKTFQRFESVINGKKERLETSIIHKNGSRVEIAVTAGPICIDGTIQGMMGTALDITEKKQHETLLRGQNEIMEMVTRGYTRKEVLKNIILLIESISNGGLCSILLVDDSKTKLVHGAAPHLPESYTRYIDGVLIGESAGSCGTAAFLKQPVLVSDIANSPLWNDFYKIALHHGLRASWSYPVFDNHQQVLGTFAMYYKTPRSPGSNDLQIIKEATYLTSLILQHYEAEEKINFMAFYDPLTNLPNRRLFEKRVKEVAESAGSHGNNFGIMYLDLNRFKLINDSLGHNLGDTLLKNVAARVADCLQEKDTVSRYGGDEFVILLANADKEKISQMAKRIFARLEHPFHIEGHEIFITPSIGASLYEEHGKNFEELIKRADLAMYQAKQKRESSFQLYDAQMGNQAYEYLETENSLRKAVERNEFLLYYQPIMDLKTNNIAGVEALLRWQKAASGFISPSEFIPLAEETGQIVHIGEWVLRTACSQMKAWLEAGINLETVSVNLSIRQFYQSNFVQMVKQVLQDTGLDPKHLALEVTESMTIDVEVAATILQELKKLGVRICIDDFGTGYSSLSYLKKFPLDCLKIDQSFISDMVKSDNDESIVTAIISMAKSLRLKTIAEGVETLEQLDILRQSSCDEVQGFFINKPLTADAFKAFWLHGKA